MHYTTNCNTQPSAPEDEENNCPKLAELTGIINKPLLLHLVGCLYYLYQWCTVKRISDNEIYLLIKYIKSVLWGVAKRLSYILGRTVPKGYTILLTVADKQNLAVSQTLLQPTVTTTTSYRRTRDAYNTDRVTCYASCARRRDPLSPSCPGRTVLKLSYDWTTCSVRLCFRTAVSCFLKFPLWSNSAVRSTVDSTEAKFIVISRWFTPTIL